jgi:hypothetical protein
MNMHSLHQGNSQLQQILQLQSNPLLSGSGGNAAAAAATAGTNTNLPGAAAHSLNYRGIQSGLGNNAADMFGYTSNLAGAGNVGPMGNTGAPPTLAGMAAANSSNNNSNNNNNMNNSGGNTATTTTTNTTNTTNTATSGVGNSNTMNANNSYSINASPYPMRISQADEEKIYQLILDLANPTLREQALLELSKKREQFDDLALILWHAYGNLIIVYYVIIIATINSSNSNNNNNNSSR